LFTVSNFTLYTVEHWKKNSIYILPQPMRLGFGGLVSLSSCHTGTGCSFLSLLSSLNGRSPISRTGHSPSYIEPMQGSMAPIPRRWVL
jgi:hypothetical protein